jgi:preprotein translocase subunit SecG
MLRALLLSLHIVFALLIIGLVLMQRGKGAEAGAGFGSGASGTVFGARGTATLFSKLTAVFAALFFTTSLLLAYMGTRSSGEPSSVIERAAQAAAQAKSAQPQAAPSQNAAPQATPPQATTREPQATQVPAPATQPPAPTTPDNK